ncbi:MAG: phage tail assembly protein [Halobacteriota archaeon]
MSLQTEFEFTLPNGYVDETGTLHREGIMRLATGADEILPLKDPRVQGNEAYLSIIVLSRVVIKLGTLAAINPRVIEGLFVADLAYLQEFYNRINSTESAAINVICPRCEHRFDYEVTGSGEYVATPSSESSKR